MSKRWRIGVVGTNTVGKTHVRVLSQMPNVELVALCDHQPERAHASMEKAGVSGIPVYTDQKKMLAEHKFDVVTVATPSGDHLPPAMLAMEAGAHVILEKPVEIQVDRIDKLIARSKELGKRLAYISQNRWNDAHRALKDAADQGRFGQIAWAGCFTPWYRPDKYYEDGGWRGTWALDGGGAIMNQSIHAIDLLQWICGPIKKVAAFASSRIHPKIETEDTGSATVMFENGAFGTIVGTTAMYPGSQVRIEIGGENGTAVSEAGLKTYKFRDERPEDKALQDRINGGGGGDQSRGAQNAADIGAQLHHRNFMSILEAWEQGRDAETSAQEGRKSVAIVLALYESVRNGGSAVEVR